jgi:hypothetical protein
MYILQKWELSHLKRVLGYVTAITHNAFFKREKGKKTKIRRTR